MAHTERGSALLALRARALAKFGELDTVPVRENNPFKIEKKKYENIRKKSIRVLRKKKHKKSIKKSIKEKHVTGLEPETNRAKAHDLDH